MTAGPSIRIGADISGVTQALTELRAKVGAATESLQGQKITIDPSKAKQGLAEIVDAVQQVHKALEKASTVGGTGLGGDTLASLSKGLEQAVAPAKELQQIVAQIGGPQAGLSDSVDQTRALIHELEKANRLKQALGQEGHSVSGSQALALEREYQRRMSLGGPGSKKLKSFGELSKLVTHWRDLAPMSELDARRRQRALLQSFGLSTATPANRGKPAGSADAPSATSQSKTRPTSGPQPAKTPRPKTRPQTPSEPPSFSQFLSHTSQHAGRAVLGSVLPDAGAGGTMLRHAASAASASEGGMYSGAGMARLAVGSGLGLAVLGATRLAGAAREKLHAAEDESSGYADLQRQLGSTVTEFDSLRTAIRSAASAIGVNYSEGGKLARAYVAGAGVDGIAAPDLRREVAGAGGFARSLGLDPSQGVELFANLRRNQASNNDGDNRRFALMIGEAVARAGVFSKADQVLGAVADFTSMATRASFGKANVEGFVGGMTGLLATHLPGMDPQAASSLLGVADHAIRHNGNEAFRNLFLGVAQHAAPGINAVDADLLRDGGAMGSFESAFGEQSVGYRMAQARGDQALSDKYRRLALAGGRITNIDRLLDDINGRGKDSKNGKGSALDVDSDSVRKTLEGLGYSSSQAAAVMLAHATNGSVSQAVKGFAKYGVDPSQLGDTSVRNLLNIEYGDDSARKHMVERLRTATGPQRLSDSERKELDTAVAGASNAEGGSAGKGSPDGEARLKAVLIKLAGSRNMEENEGDESRRSAANLDNLASDMATKLIPLTNSIREGIMHLASMAGYKDTYGLSERSQAELDRRLQAAKDNPTQRRQILGSFHQYLGEHEDSFTPEYRAKVGRMFDAAVMSDTTPEVGNTHDRRSGSPDVTDRVQSAHARQLLQASPYDAMFKDAATRYGVDWTDLKQIGVQESSLARSARNFNKNGTVDEGIMQLNSRYHRERGLTDPMDPAQNIMAGAAVWARALRDANGNVREAFRRYNGSGPDAERYADNAMHLRALARAQSSTQGLTSGTQSESNTSGTNTKPTAPQNSSNGFGMMPKPAGANASLSTSASAPQPILIHGTFHLRDPDTNQALADPVVQSIISSPRPVGSRSGARL